MYPFWVEMVKRLAISTSACRAPQVAVASSSRRPTRACRRRRACRPPMPHVAPSMRRVATASARHHATQPTVVLRRRQRVPRTGPASRAAPAPRHSRFSFRRRLASHGALWDEPAQHDFAITDVSARACDCSVRLRPLLARSGTPAPSSAPRSERARLAAAVPDARTVVVHRTDVTARLDRCHLIQALSTSADARLGLESSSVCFLNRREDLHEDLYFGRFTGSSPRMCHVRRATCSALFLDVALMSRMVDKPNDVR